MKVFYNLKKKAEDGKKELKESHVAMCPFLTEGPNFRNEN